jgi:benzoyl-CoA reductase/2-hydroxyglutaryl-CoA dehydratase subunit BcrC/BadD/HgdB
MGVPHNKSEDALDYYLEGLQILKEKLESFTGNTITDERLKEEIEYGNKVRKLFKAISFMRRDVDPPISSRDFAKLHHASFYADKTVFLEILESLFEELKQIKSNRITKKPRILFTGSTLAFGDNRIFDMLDDIDGEVVVEEFAEGIRPYMDNVDTDSDDLMKGMAEAYFLKRIPAPWDRPWGDRLERLMAMAKDFNVDGVLWYQLMYRDGYDIQAYWYEKKFMEKANLPMLKLESDYTVSEKGPMKTRMETFVEVMKGG